MIGRRGARVRRRRAEHGEPNGTAFRKPSRSAAERAALARLTLGKEPGLVVTLTDLVERTAATGASPETINVFDVDDLFDPLKMGRQ